MNNLTKKDKTRRLAESALMIALATILAEFTVFEFPFGGSVTLFSQLPIVILSYRYGVKWGLVTGFTMSLLQMVFGAANFSYVSGITSYLILAFADYIVAFTALGLGGMFKNTVKNQAIALGLGGAVTSLIRYACHIISGVTIWKEYAGDTPVWEYSVTYNGGYMIPELIITVIGAVIIGSIFDFSRNEIKVLRKKDKNKPENELK